MTSLPIPPAHPPDIELGLTGEELALLRASVAFHARCVADPALRARLERAAAKLGQLAASAAGSPPPAPASASAAQAA